MTTPPELLEQSLEAYGDTLYRIALVVAGDERGAAALLRDVDLAEWQGPAAPGAAPPDEPALLARLVAAARRQEERQARRGDTRTPRPSRVNHFAPFPLHSLSLDQRLAVSLYLLLGYDGAHLAGVLSCDEASARAALIAGARALGPAAGHALTDRVSGEQCDGMRAALVDPALAPRQSAAVRGHLAACAPCRAFDQAWGAILQAAEGALRGALRERTMPAALRARLVAGGGRARGRGARTWRQTRVAVVPLGVLALIAALVLPGFLREPVSVVERGERAPVDAQALIAKALERQATPPDRGGVWHGRYETLWFFNDDTYAPMRAEVWLDPDTPARHRLQLTHRDGGAPYELQIGDGTGRLAYALDAAYAPALYGGLPLGARDDQPALLDQQLDPAGQVRARDERLQTGPWLIPPSYLRQAQRATDLRLLGRQREGGRLVQLLSFSGVSPLGLPPDAPGATAERVTVLLALDSEDGLLRSATELMGPAGAAQTSRVTWRLVEERWLTGGEQIREAFDVERAWTGIGDFSRARMQPSADLAVPLVPQQALSDPVLLLTHGLDSFWLPAIPPSGVDRALLIWNVGLYQRESGPVGLIYLGQGRRLVLAFNRSPQVEGERLAVGPWRVSLRPGRGQHYTAFLARPQPAAMPERDVPFDVTANLTADAYGFTRAELLAVFESMRPFDIASLEAQDGLFIRAEAGDLAARAALIAVAHATASPPETGARLVRARWFTRQAPELRDERQDPYHLAPYGGLPQTVIADQWQSGSGEALAFYEEVSDPVSGVVLERRYTDSERLWMHLAAADVLTGWSGVAIPMQPRLAQPGSVALELLATPGELALISRPGGGSVIRHSESAATSGRYSYSLNSPTHASPFLYDLRPVAVTHELELDARGEVGALRVYAESQGVSGVTRTLVESYEVIAREDVPLAEAPAALRDGAEPASGYARHLLVAQEMEETPLLTSQSLDEALAAVEGPVYVPARGVATLLLAERGPPPSPQGGAFMAVRDDDVTAWAVGENLAVRLSYRVPAGEATPDSFEVRLTQGPAGPLRAFLRSKPDVPWISSEPMRLSIAGREVDGWVGTGGQVYIIAEIGETLLIVASPRPPPDPQLLALLAGLRPAVR